MERISTVEEYKANIDTINEHGASIYRYMNFNQIPAYQKVSETVNQYRLIFNR